MRSLKSWISAGEPLRWRDISRIRLRNISARIPLGPKQHFTLFDSSDLHFFSLSRSMFSFSGSAGSFGVLQRFGRGGSGSTFLNRFSTRLGSHMSHLSHFPSTTTAGAQREQHSSRAPTLYVRPIVGIICRTYSAFRCQNTCKSPLLSIVET
jgi:hypothetical protein